MTRYTVGFDYPAHISFEKQRYGSGTQTHLEKRVILEKWYSNLRGYLPEVYKGKLEEYNEKILPLLNEAADFIEALNLTYDASFEGILTCNPKEKDFTRLMFNTCICLDEITARSGILEKAKMPSEMIGAGV